MNTHATMNRLRAAGVIAVVRARHAEEALRVSDALIAGGIIGIEITFTTPGAEDAIRRARAMHGDRIVVGAGTVTSAEHIRRAADAGAEYLVSPGSPPSLVTAMADSGLLTMTGCLTPTEAMVALEAGAHVIKLFPSSLGGIPYLRALRGPFPDLPIVPTGGITPENAREWIAAGALAVGAGSDLTPASAIASEHWDEITRRARAFVQALA